MLKFLVTFSILLLIIEPMMAATQLPYCLSRVGSPKPKARPSRESDAFATLDFQLRNVPYRISAIDRDWVQLYRLSHSNNNLRQVKVPLTSPWKLWSIQRFEVDKYGWLWIQENGISTDYIAPFTYVGGNLTLGERITVSTLVRHPCSYLSNFFSGCLPAGSSYSSTLRQVFVTGYEVSLFGISNLQTYTIIAGKLTPLPQNAQGARLDYEVPAANGVILRGTHNEVIFFDGQRSTILLPKNNWWGFKDTPDGKRAFLTQLMTSQGQGQEKSFSLQELTPGPKLTPISVPSNFTSDLALFTVPKDPTLWVIFQDGLFAQVNGRFQKVFTFSKPMSFDNLESVWQTPDGAIGFNLKDLKSTLRGSEGGTNYFLRRRSSTANCQIPISVGGR
jgi:hypothetical protein